MTKRKVNIAYIATPIEFGGAEKVSLNFLENANKELFQIHLLLLIRPWERTNLFLKKAQKLDYSVSKIPVAIRPGREGRDYFRIIRCFAKICIILAKGSFDLIHTHGYFADIMGIMSAKLLGIPIISTCHGFIENDSRLSWYNLIDRIALRFFDRIIAVSEGIADDLQRSSIKKARIKVIPNAVQTEVDHVFFLQSRKAKRDLFKIGDNDFCSGYIGRLSQEKGLENLIYAGALLKEMGIPIKVLIVGDGPQKETLKNLAKEKGLGTEVFFPGFQSDVKKWIPAMDVFVLPSFTEGTPMALLEAMAYGVPIVASAVGGIPAVISSEETGLLISPGKPNEVKNAILRFYNNPSLRACLAKAAKEKLNRDHNIDIWIKQIEAQYNDLIEQ